MELSKKAQDLKQLLVSESTKMGDIKKAAKGIKKNHDLAEELWQTGDYQLQLLSTLILDKNLLTESYIDQLISDIQHYPDEKKHYIIDWLFANQMMKSKKTIALLASWENHEHVDYRRLYWYYQARLRWSGKNPLENSDELVEKIVNGLETEEPSVQWMMNFTAGWIGTFEPKYRKQLTLLGERVGLYKEEKAPKGCTPSYLPDFIRVEVSKREK